jgi:glucose-6-phosphate isomerase
MARAFKRKRWREEQRLRIDVNGMMAHMIGEEGLTDADLEALSPRLGEIHAAVDKQRRAGSLPFAELPYEKTALKRTLALASEVRGRFDDLVVLAIGGSALGTRALYSALKPPGHATAPVTNDDLRLHVADTIDPSAFGDLLGRLDLRRTVFNVISKSGDTAETMSQFLIVRDRLMKELGAVDYAQHIVVTTDAAAGTLRQIVNDEGFRDLPVPPNVGGRFSVLTPVGLFPAACAGIDVAELLAGAAEVDERWGEDDPRRNPALMHAATLYLARERKGRRELVLMPYSQPLAAFADWFCELWAESLGKAVDLDGRPAHTGQTPIRAVGPTDQHSLLQLLVEGPADKAVVFIRVEEHDDDVPVPKSYEDLGSVSYLGGTTLGTLMNMEQQGTELALAKAGRMTSTIVCPRLNAFVVGQLVYLFELETVVTAGLLNVNAFDQPGVEESKQLTYGLAGRPGYEAKRADVQRWTAKKETRYVL